MIDSHLAGEDHLAKVDPPHYFSVGHVNPEKGFVHVFDDDSLEFVMRTLDTAADFVAYLRKKEAFLTQSRGVIATGEEELLAFYLKQLNSAGEHDFVLPANLNALFLPEGHWEAFCHNPQRLAQIEANRVSYLWDTLIEKFSYHIMTGTQQFSSSDGPHESELPLRMLATENRTRRRMLAQGLLDVVNTANATQKFVRVYQGTRPNEPYYVLLSIPSTGAKSHEQYREVRRNLLWAYCLVCKHVHRDAEDIVGIAVSPTSETSCSEDLLYLDARKWTPEQDAEAARLQAELGILTNVQWNRGNVTEYPPVEAQPVKRFVPRGRIPRNDPCPCGSGKKFKKCCGGPS